MKYTADRAEAARKTRQRNDGIDILRLICAGMVVCIHAGFPGGFGLCVKAVSRAAVPVFLLISGYHLDGRHMVRSCKKQMCRLMALFGIANLFYILWHAALACARGESVVALIKGCVTPVSLIKLLVFGESPAEVHLWYLMNTAMAYAMICAAQALGLLARLGRGAFALIAVNLAVGVYAIPIFGVQIPPTIARSCYLTCLPFMLLGMSLRARAARLRRLLKPRRLTCLTLLFSALAVLERIAMHRACPAGEGDLYISTVFLSVFLFLRFALWPVGAGAKRLARFGRDGALWIYLLHPAIADGLWAVPAPVRPVAVLTVSSLAAIGMSRINWRALARIPRARADAGVSPREKQIPD